MRGVVTSLLLLALVTGCASPKTPVPPVQPESTVTAPAATGPAPSPAPHQPAGRVHPDKLALADVAYVVASTSPPASRSALLWPSTHAASIAALVNAFNSVTYGDPRQTTHLPRLSVSFQMKRPGADSVSLQINGDDGGVLMGWNGGLFAIDSPAVANALADLEPLLQPLPKPGTRLWAVDPAGSKPPELRLDIQQALQPTALSPDGRYSLLYRPLGEYKGDYSGVPYLLDLTTGSLREGAQTEIRSDPAWSGKGFFINWPAHLDLTLKEDGMPALRKALGLQPNVREVIHLSFSGNGKRFAALVGDRSQEKPLELILGNSDGTALTVVPAALTGTATQIGIVARAALSPDGEWLNLAGKGPAIIMRVADALLRERWTHLADTAGWEPITWSPDSRYVAISGRVYDRTGKVVLESRAHYIATWRSDSKAVVIHDYALVQILGLDGTEINVAVPDWSVPVGFLADGRLLVGRTVYPGQQ